MSGSATTTLTPRRQQRRQLIGAGGPPPDLTNIMRKHAAKEAGVELVQPAPIPIQVAPAYAGLWKPARLKIVRGGRGSAKSYHFADAAIARAYTRHERILCGREFQTSIKDSVHQLLCDRIKKHGLAQWFNVTDKSIESRTTESKFFFKGMRHNIDGIRSTQGVTIFWNEEAESTSADSLQIIEPTIRENDSELWFSYNPLEENAPVHRLALNPPPDSWSIHTTYRDNPWFPEVLERSRLHMLNTDPDAYDWVWEGQTRKISDAVIFKRNVIFETFDEPPHGTQLFHGADWGFSEDPTVLIRCWTTKDPSGKDHLWIDREAFGYGTELDDIPALFDTIETARKWPIKADNSRPETISYVKRQGFQISAADKWNGSVEDGIAHLKSMTIHIHSGRCPKIAQEARLYSYKTDTRQLDAEGKPTVLPIIVDKHNHGWDASRYALDGHIQARGSLGMWSKLGKR